MNSEQLYLQLGQLISEMPDLNGNGPITPEINRWLGRAAYLVEVSGDAADTAILSLAANSLCNDAVRTLNAQTISAVVYRALARAEALAPTSTRGAFIGVGAALDALQIYGRVLSDAKQDIFIVDAYMDTRIFTEFASQGPTNVSVRLLSDSHSTKPEALRPGASAWQTQFGTARPLQIRLSLPRALHDRLILIDNSQAWTVSQSTKNIAARSPALVQKLDREIARQKVVYYESIWNTGTPVT